MDYSSIFVILMGLGTVFFGLICLIALTTVMGRVLSRKAAPVSVTPAVPAAPAAAAEPDRPAIAAAIAAAVAEELGVGITGIRILSMKKL